MNTQFLLSELLLQWPQSLIKSLPAFSAVCQLQMLDPPLTEETAAACPGDSQPSPANPSCLLRVMWEDIKLLDQALKQTMEERGVFPTP